jgi:chromosome segregation ATPase
MTASEYQQLVEFLGPQFSAIDQRFDSLQQHIDERFREVFGHFDEIYRRLERLEQEYHAITQALRRIEGLLADEVGRREVLERGLEELKRHVTGLQARIEDLERHLRS